MRLLQNSVQSADFCNYQRYNGAYQDLYRKSRIRAARKKRRTMDDDLRIPYSSSERTMKGRGKKTQQKELTNVIPDHRLIGMCVSVRMVRPSPRSPERQSPVPAAGRFPGLRIITKVRLPGCQSSDNSVLHFPLTVTRSYRICTCFPFDFGRKKVPSSAPAVIFSFYKYSI